MSDFKRLADCVYGILDTKKSEPLTAEQCKGLDEVQHILTTLAVVANDEPAKYTRLTLINGDNVNVVTEAYAEWQRNGWLKAEIEIKRLRKLLSWANDKCNDCENGPELRAENEQLKQHLAYAQRHQPIIEAFFNHIDSMNDLCEPNFTADKVLKRFLDEVNPILARMHFERRAQWGEV